MDRRRFVQFSTLATIGSQLNLPAQPLTHRGKVGIAPIGLGSIAEVFMAAVTKTTNTQLAGFVTGHPQEKGVRFARQYNVPEGAIFTYENVSALRDHPEIDAVYVALPNSMHCDYTVRAAEAGKHVLCEKPMAISSAECQRMIDACRAARVKLMVAYRIRFDATFERVRRMIQAGELGQIQACQGGFYGMKNKQEWRLKRSLAGGGSLLDLGIYPLHTISWLLDETPRDFRAFVATRDTSGKFAEVEQSVEWLMKFPSGILATCGSSYGQSGTNFLQINGTSGHVRVEPAFVYGDTVLKLTGRSEAGEISGGGPVNNPDQFVSEIFYFSDCVLQNRQPTASGEVGLADLKAIEAIYAAAGAPIA